MSNLKKRLIKASKVGALDLEKSDIFTDVEFCPTDIPILNVALSGDIDGGVSRGITIWAGPSRHFKTIFGLLCVKAFMDKHGEESICSFLDSEYGSTPAYFANAGCDTERFIWSPIKDLEDLKVETVAQAKEIQKGEKVIFFVDSIGNTASKKEIADAEDGESKEDAGRRAKEGKSVMRTIMPYLNTLSLPMIIVGHVYQTLEKYSKVVVSGGTGPFLAANNIITVSRKQLEEDGDKKSGKIFVLTIEKSRFVKEGKKFEIKVSQERGVYKYSGLLPIAVEGGFVVRPSVRKEYIRPDVDDTKFREEVIDTSDEFWKPILENQKFKEYVRSRFQLNGALMRDPLAEPDFSEIEEEVEDGE